MSHASTLPVPASLIDLDHTFLPVAHMRQIARVTALEEGVIEEKWISGRIIGSGNSTSPAIRFSRERS